jgi:hypothetical protein
MTRREGKRYRWHGTLVDGCIHCSAPKTCSHGVVEIFLAMMKMENDITDTVTVGCL